MKDELEKVSESENVETKPKEEQKVKKRYQWIKGENSGDVEIYEEAVYEKNIEFMIFESGRRINSQLLSEFMMEVAAGQELLMHNEPHSTAPNKLSGNKPINPIKMLLGKQKSFDHIIIPIDFKLSIPKPELFEVFYESFGDEFKDAITETVMETYDVKTIKKTIEESIKVELDRKFELLQALSQTLNPEK